MGEGAEHLAGRTGFDDFAVAHHRHLVGEAGDHREVVGDEDHAHAVFVDEPLQEFDDTGLGGDVEGGGGLVGDQQFGPERDGRGDDDALALAARELVRKAVARKAVGGEADALEHAVGLGQGLAAAGLAVHPDGHGHLVADGL